MKKIFFSLIISSMIAFTACENKTGKESSTTSADSSMEDKTSVAESPKEDTAAVAGAMEKGGIKVTPQADSPEFPDAIIEMNEPKENAKLKPGVTTFSYEVKNYQLGSQTPDAANKHCANSDKGQHIHLILNNAPYIAKYDTKFTDTLKEGHYVALSFLSRSYHESLKHREAYDLRQFTVGKAEQKNVDLTKPHMFYSRPKGEYVGDDTKRILLDFYLVNTKLSPTENKVRATINGNEFILENWQPYIIEGLGMGEATIKLELIDKDGKLIEGPFNSVERKITLKDKKA